MTEPAAPHGTTSTVPPPSANGSAPPPPPTAAQPGRQHTRISGLLLAAIAGALLMAAAGTARITQLRRIIRRDHRKHKQAEQAR
jgi:hypothetical protein